MNVKFEIISGFHYLKISSYVLSVIGVASIEESTSFDQYETAVAKCINLCDFMMKKWSMFTKTENRTYVLHGSVKMFSIIIHI